MIALAPLVRGHDLKLQFPLPRTRLLTPPKQVRAVDGVDIALSPGETLSIVGESGSGKSSLGRLLVGALRPSSGSVRFGELDINATSRRDWTLLRSQMQMIFQQAGASFNPRRTVGRHLHDVFAIHPELRPANPDAAIAEAFDRVGLPRTALGRYAHELSGGQQQRAAIARALLCNPRFIVCDEIVSALDLSVQAQVLNLLAEIQRDTKVALLFISHDLSVVRYLSHRVAVMYVGKVVETGIGAHVFGAPRHPYTQALLDAVPSPDPGAPPPQVSIGSQAADAAELPGGCRFHPRCPFASELCRRTEPPLQGPLGHQVACHHPLAEGRQ